MKEFVKIFIVLCAVVGAFFFGRNFGEETQNESTEIKTLKSENVQNRNAQIELENLKEKFQKLLDSSDLKKANEVVGQVMTIFLADLNLRLSEKQLSDFNEGKRACEPAESQKSMQKSEQSRVPEESSGETESRIQKEAEASKFPIKNVTKFKSAEVGIKSALDSTQIRDFLKDLEVRKVDSLSENSSQSTFQQSKKFFGIYRGSVLDVTGKTYGTMVFEVESTPSEKAPIKGNIKLFQKGIERMGDRFNSTGLGYATAEYEATVIQFGSSNFLQVYKVEAAQKIAGIYYERLPNGTSKTIGTFVLSRTDFTE